MDFFESLWSSLSEYCQKIIPLGSNSITTLNIIVWSLFIGFVIAIIITVYNKIFVGAFVRGLIERNAFTEETAVAASELEYSRLVIPFLKNGAVLRRMITVAGADKQPKTVTTQNKLYIKEEYLKKADTIYKKTDLTPMSVLIGIGVLVIVVLLSLTVIPTLVGMLLNFLESITPSGNVM